MKRGEKPDMAKLAGMSVNEYAAEIMTIASPFMYGLDVANKVNHDAFNKGLVSYEHFRVAAQNLSNIILSR